LPRVGCRGGKSGRDSSAQRPDRSPLQSRSEQGRQRQLPKILIRISEIDAGVA